MSYQSLLLEEGINAQYLAVLKPCRKVTTWTLHSGSVYRAGFDFGYVASVEVGGVSLTEAASTSLSAGQFYWDNDNEIVYIRCSDSGNPNSKFVVLVYEIYVSTFDAHWYRAPTDSSTLEVYYEPLIARVPSIKSTVKDVAFGLMPVQSTGIVLNNAEKILNKHLFDGSFRGRNIEIYHQLGDLDIANIKLVMRGRMDALSWEDSTLSIKIFDSLDVFETEFRAPQGESFYSSSLYPDIDSNFEGRPIRFIYGIVDGFVPVNVDYLADNPTTAENRVWKVACDGFNIYQKTGTVPVSPSSSATGTFVDDATGFTAGDSVRIIKATPESTVLNTVDYVNNYLTHDSLGSGNASGGATVLRGAVGRIDIIQQGQKFTPLYQRDYTESVDVNGVIGFVLSSSLESNLSMPATLSPADSVFCRIYGKQNNVTLGGPSYGSNDSESGNLMMLPAILLDVLKRFTGLSETEINTASFTDLASDSDDRLGFAIPNNSSSKFPKVKEIITDICQTGLVSLYLDDDLKWAASRLKAIGAVSGSIESDEILDRSIEYYFDYSDVYSDVVVSFAKRERKDNGIGEGYSLERSSSNTALYLHKINRTLEVKSLHYDRSHAARLALRLSDLYGDRQGELTIETKNRFFGFTIDEILRVIRASLPGFDYDQDTDQSIDLNIRQTEKSLRRVKLILNDLKGITDNSGDF